MGTPTLGLMVRFATAVIAGVTTTVVVAGLCAWHAKPLLRGADEWGHRIERDDGGWYHQAAGQFGYTSYFSRHIPEDPMPICGTGLPWPMFPQGKGSRASDDDLFPSWRPQPPEQTPPYLTHHVNAAAGFPLRCFAQGSGFDASWRHFPPEKNLGLDMWLASGQLRIFSGGKRWPRFDSSFPVSPLPGRIAANSVFYASVWWLLLPIPRRLVRAVRNRSGSCRACGYSMAGLPDSQPCPECGLAQQ